MRWRRRIGRSEFFAEPLPPAGSRAVRRLRQLHRAGGKRYSPPAGRRAGPKVIWKKPQSTGRSPRRANCSSTRCWNCSWRTTSKKALNDQRFFMFRRHYEGGASRRHALQQSLNGNILVQRVPMDAASAELIPARCSSVAFNKRGNQAKRHANNLASL